MGRFFNLVKDNFIVHILLITIVSVVIFWKPAITPGFPSWADNTLPTLNLNVFHELANFAYVDKNVGLVYYPVFVTFYFFLEKIFLLFSLTGLSPHSLAFLWVFLPYYFLYLTVYLILKKYFFKPFISFMLTIFYIFSILNFSWILSGWSTTTYSQATCVITLLLFLIYLKQPSWRLIVVICLSTLLGVSNIANLAAIFLVCAFALIVYIPINNIKLVTFIKTHYHLSVATPLSLVLHSYWILPFLSMYPTYPPSLDASQIYSSSYLTFFNTFFFYNSGSEFPGYTKVFGVFNSLPYRIFYLTLLFIVVSQIKKFIPKDKMLMYLLAIFLFIFSLCLGKNLPAIWNAVQLFPGAFLFRAPQFRFFSPLFVVLLLVLGRIMTLSKSRLFTYAVVLGITINIYGFYKGDIFSEAKNMVLPEDYSLIISYLQSTDNSHETIMVLPKFKYTPDIDWRDSNVYAYPILDQVLSNPMIMFLYSKDRIPKAFYSFYDKNSNIDNYGEYLGLKGVKFILTYKDSKQFPFTNPFSDDQGLNKVVSGENVDLYEVDSTYLNQIIYSKESSLSFKRLAPGKYLVHTDSTSNVKDNCEITFNRQFDSNIAMYSLENLETHYLNSILKPGFNISDIGLLKLKELYKQSIDMNSQYGNTWSTCNIPGDFLIYFRPQIYLYIGVLVTGASLVGALSFLLINLRPSNKNSTNEEFFS